MTYELLGPPPCGAALLFDAGCNCRTWMVELQHGAERGRDYDRGRYRLSGGWKDGGRVADYFVASICHGGWHGGGGGNDKHQAGSEGCIERGTGAQCGGESGGSVLHRRVPTRSRASEDGVLGGADHDSCEPGDRADDAGNGRSGRAGITTVCGFRDRDQG